MDLDQLEFKRSMENKSISGNQFEWPEFNSDKERIKTYTQKYKNCTVEEAFKDVYGDLYEISTSSPQEILTPTVGNIIDIQIIKKENKISFNTNLSAKYEIICINNLNHLSKDKIKCKALITEIKSNKNQILVDIVTPIIDNFLQSRLDNPEYHYNNMNTVGNPDIFENIKLQDNGYTCQIEIKELSDIFGKPYYIFGFIPGSQIVLNIEKDFNKWDGYQSLTGNIIGYYIDKKNNKLSVTCSRKNYLQFVGKCTLKSWFDIWCDFGPEWKVLSNEILSAKVTGIIHSTEKCGIFVEISDKFINGLIQMDPEELTKYHPDDLLFVKLDSLEESIYYNDITQQNMHNVPFDIETLETGEKILKQCNIKPLFKIVST